MTIKYTADETEKIISITEIDDNYIGYNITTNKQVIKVSIEDFQDCCEIYGAKIELQVQEAECYSKTLTDLDEIFEYIKDKELLKIYWSDEDVGIDIIFEMSDNVSFTCNVWNDHNGYYPHNYKIIIDNKEYTGTL